MMHHGDRPAFLRRSGFGPWLRAQRRRAGLSQADLAAVAGCSASYVSMVEQGRARFARERLDRIAAQLRVDVTTLVQLSGYDRPLPGVPRPRPPAPAVATSMPRVPPPPRAPAARRALPPVAPRRRPYHRLGADVRAARMGAGLVIGALADRVGVTGAHITGIELGYHRPSTALIARLAVVLGLDAGELRRLVGFGEAGAAPEILETGRKEDAG